MTTVAESKSSPASEVHHCEECGAPMLPAHVLTCKSCGEVIRLRCFVYRHAGVYVAECIDLDISAEGTTESEAIKGLQDAMLGYLHVAFDGRDIKGLILRPSPPIHRLRYHLAHFTDRLSAILFNRRKRTREQFYSVPFPSHCG